MMLVLSGEQVGERWEIIKAALKLSALPTADTNEDKLSNILESLLAGKAVCWMSGNKRRPRTVVITSIGYEEVSATKNMLVYCAHGFEKETPQQYKDMLVALKNYALQNGCHNIISYVGNSGIVKVLKSFGAQCDYTLVVFPLIN